MTNEAAPAARSDATPQPDERGSGGALRSERTWRVVSRSLLAAWIVAIGLLLFMPPSISYGSQAFAWCRPLSPGTVSDATINGFPSYTETRRGVEASLKDWSTDSTEIDRLQAKLGGAEACSDARTNQQTLLTVVLAAGLAVMLGITIRNQRRSLAQVAALGATISKD